MKKFEGPKASKREDGVDFISNMPDTILLSILSGLRSTEEVIRTSILSKRWRYLWTSVSVIDICCNRRRSPEIFEENEFIEFVYWVLLNKSVDLDRFRLYCSNHLRMLTVRRWIQAAVTKKVKELDLTLWLEEESEKIEMPHCLITCGSVEELRLSLGSCRLIAPSVPGFSALRVLELEDIDLLDGDLVKYFLESCPILEDVSLVDCVKDKIDLLCISSPNLKNLKFYDRNSRSLCGYLKISCPNLVFLDLDGYVASDFFFERLDSLKEAVLDPAKNVYRSAVLFPGISQVESLQIELSFFCQCCKAARDPALPNLKTLKLTATNAAFDDGLTAPEFNQILKCCPKLESLNLVVENMFIYPEGYWGPEDLKLAEAKIERILTPEVKCVESFEYNGEKLRLNICWSGSEWSYIDAKWGKENTFLKK